MSLQRVVIAPEQRQGQHISLTSAQQRYLRRVLRLNQGDRFVALDGQGGQWLAELVDEPLAALVEALEAPAAAAPEITLLAALPKGSGFDEVVRQVTELGVSRIWPVISDRTLMRPSDQKLERWQRIAAEATEQCERLTTPEIRAPLRWQTALEALRQEQPTAAAYLCVTRRECPHLLMQLQQDQPSAVAVAIGPEGGWTDAEVAAALALGWRSVSLGQSILRAITAPTVALSLIGAVLTVQTLNPPHPQQEN